MTLDSLDTGWSLWRLTEDPIRDSSSGLRFTEPTSLVELPELVFLCLLKECSLLSVGFFYGGKATYESGVVLDYVVTN